MIYRWLYTGLFYCLLPAILLRLLYRSIRAAAYRHRWSERFGIIPSSTSDSASAIWLHAVSVGEALAAAPLIRALQQEYPDKKLVVTTTTPTGSERVTSLFAQEMADKKIVHVYAPYDVPYALNKFLDSVRPQLLIVMETELWPNMIHCCSQRQVPILIANARLSEKSARGYARISCLSKSMFNEITIIAAQNNQDGQRFVDLGLDKEKLQVTGSIKFDLELSVETQDLASKLKNTWGDNGKRTVFLAASTHPGEDEIILRVFQKCRERSPDLLLILVPRHPERFNTIYQLCLKSGFNTVRRSDIRKNEETATLEPVVDIVLGDTMGELLVFYGACDIAFVGGSLVAVGGHNLIEPAAWAKPIVTGQHLFNFADVAEMLKQQQAILVCESEKDLQTQVERLLLDRSKRMLMGAAAQKTANKNRGALQKLLSEIKFLLK